MADENSRDDENSTHEAKCRWSSYGNYRLIIWVWMMNETTIMFSPAELSHNGYYYHAIVQTFGVIFIGIPLVYSEITIAQFTNCDVLTMWNFFPLFRYVGFGTIYLLVLKTIYVMVLASWSLVYTFYASLDPPPWFSCDNFSTTQCIVKRVNVSIFQHCLEAQMLFGDDCGIQTASACLFDREIGSNNTDAEKSCFFTWKAIIACSSISFLLIVLSIRKQKYMEVVVKFLAAYLSIVILILFGVALSTSGTWYASTISLHWQLVTVPNSFNSLTRGLLSVGTGCGIIIFLSKDVSFRSPATMTAISTSLFSHVICLLFAIISFSGIKTMSFFHGEEEFVIEVNDSMFFSVFASISEIMTYFSHTIWGFLWFSSVTFCLFSNLWVLHLYLGDIMFKLQVARNHNNLACCLLVLFINFITWPFFCSDLAGALADVAELIQIFSNFLFSFAFYWVYGYKTHIVDIIFMIGVKSSYFWKIAWMLNPIVLMSILYNRFKNLQIRTYGDSFKPSFLPIEVDWLLFWLLLGVYMIIVIVGICVQLIVYYRQGVLRAVFSLTEQWGPSDIILYKSRKMFVPEIMTTEFLYRQVRIRGYNSQKRHKSMYRKRRETIESFEEEIEWSALTSN